MTTEVQTFAFPGNRDTNIRSVLIDGKPWLIARDVALLLGYSNPTKAVRDHCRRSQVNPKANVSFSLHPQTALIPEGDVNRLIMRSKLPQAEAIQDRVTDEVLPTIRQHGVYATSPEALMAALDDPHMMKRALMMTNDKVIALTADNDRLSQEKAVAKGALDRISGMERDLCLTDAAKTLGMKVKDFIQWLHSEKRIYQRGGNGQWVPYTTETQAGRLKLKVVTRGDKERHQCLVTPKGLTFLAQALEKSNELKVA